jgi:cell division protein FtsB
MTPGIKKTIFLLGLITILLLFSSLFGERGFLHLLRLKEEKLALEEKNAITQKENALLRSRIQKLKRDDRVLERLVREELGWVKDGEILYRFRSPIDQDKIGAGKN